MSFGSVGVALLKGLAAGAGTYLVLGFGRGFPSEDASLCACLVGFGIVQLLMALELFRNDSSTLWVPMPWFLLSCGIYYGFGPLVYFFGDQEIVEFLNNVWRVGNSEIMRVSVMNAVGVFVAL